MMSQLKGAIAEIQQIFFGEISYSYNGFDTLMLHNEDGKNSPSVAFGYFNSFGLMNHLAFPFPFMSFQCSTSKSILIAPVVGTSSIDAFEY